MGMRCCVLTVKKAAEQLGISPDTIYGLCAAKKLRHERIGLGRGRICIPEDAIEEYRKRVTVGVEEALKPPPPATLKLRHVSLRPFALSKALRR